jgi:hypothetical protein
MSNIAEAVFQMIQGLSSSIAFRISVRLNIGRTGWKKVLVELLVFVVLRVPLVVAIGWLLVTVLTAIIN